MKQLVTCYHLKTSFSSTVIQKPKTGIWMLLLLTVPADSNSCWSTKISVSKSCTHIPLTWGTSRPVIALDRPAKAKHLFEMLPAENLDSTCMLLEMIYQNSWPFGWTSPTCCTDSFTIRLSIRKVELRTTSLWHFLGITSRRGLWATCFLYLLLFKQPHLWIRT